MNETSRRMRTLLYADTPDSVRRWEREPAAFGPALARRDRLLRAAIARHGGRLVHAYLDHAAATFPDAGAAVAAALDAQRVVGAEAWDPAHPLALRVAIATGELPPGLRAPVPLIHRAVRLLALGHGGHVLLDARTAVRAGAALPGDVALRDLGDRRLPDLERPERVFALVAPDLPDLGHPARLRRPLRLALAAARRLRPPSSER